MKTLMILLSITFNPKKAVKVEPKLLYSLSNSFAIVMSGDFYENYLVCLDVIEEKGYIFKNGEKVATFGKSGSAPGEFNFMKSGVVKFSPLGEIFVYDPGNSRVQIFSMEGKYKKSIPIGNPSSDFEVDSACLYFTPLMGNQDLMVINFEGKEIKSLSGRNINLLMEKFPFPIEMIEGNKETLFYGFLDRYSIKVYSKKEKEVKKNIEVKVKPIPFPEEMRKKMLEKVPQLKGRIRENMYAWRALLYDKSKSVLFVEVTTKDTTSKTFDLFSKNCDYLKRVKLENLKGNALAVDKGRLAIFNNKSLKIDIYDISSAY